jgi:tetraacyldisaccharide 4'-kinase
VVSIGNLTLGGTGKTPLTIWVARWYQQQGWRVAVLSRGYRARTPAPVRVISTGDGPLCAWQEAGDEPYLLACALPGVAVLTGKERARTGRYACEVLGAEVLILDDGFQHHALQRDLDIVLIDASNPFGPGSLFPRGILREPRRALRHADAIVLTRVEMAGARLPALCQQIRRWHARQPLYHMAMSLDTIQQHSTGQPVDLATLRQQRVVAVVGIGNPYAFVNTLTQLGMDVAALLVFPDHHPYTRADWQRIVDTLHQQHATCVLTTEKDAVRLDPAWHTHVPVYMLRIGVTFTTATPSLAQQLHEIMAHAAPR